MKTKTLRFNRVRRVVKRVGLTILGATMLAISMLPSMKARADSVELMVGHNNSTLDIKAGANITDKLATFMRARLGVDYEGTINTFALMDLYFNLLGPLDAVAEVQLVGDQFIPRFGLQYFGKSGDFSLYTMLTASASANPDLENLTKLTLDPKLNEDLGLFAQVEAITNANKDGLNFALQRIRLGLSHEEWIFGPALDLSQAGNHPKESDGTFTWTVGAFATRDF